MVHVSAKDLREPPRQCLKCYRIYFGTTDRTGRVDAPECHDCMQHRLRLMKDRLKAGHRRKETSNGW